jgi:ubiquinone/menaquinone biosynthesis C-methylase UbiE
MTRKGLLQFHELAEYYDALNDWKDYRIESGRLEAIARRFGRSGRTSWLDVACGTGRHLEHLRRNHRVVGVDVSPEMLRVARRRLPGVRLVRADMRSFALDEQFDIVSCLFSAIGHLTSKQDILRAFANFARHLKPGGVVIVEPWIERSAFRSSFVHLRSHVSPGLSAVRMSFSSRRGNLSAIHFHFLIGRPGQAIRYYEVTDHGLLLSRAELIRLMWDAGLEPRFLSRGLMPGRGLLLGTKPEPAAPSLRQIHQGPRSRQR